MRGPVPVLPSKRPTYNAGSAVEVPYVSRSMQLDAVTPASARYRIDDLTNARQILDWTTIQAPPARGTVIVSADANEMYGTVNDLELRQVIFEFTLSDGSVRQELAHYELARVYQGAS